MSYKATIDRETLNKLREAVNAAVATIEAQATRIEALEAENAAGGRVIYLLQTQNTRFAALLREAVTTSGRCTLNEQWLKSAKQALESKP